MPNASNGAADEPTQGGAAETVSDASRPLAQDRAVPAPADAGGEPARLAADLTRNAVDSLPQGELGKQLARAAKEGRPLRVKLGIDPTAPDIHLGHAVVLRKLREFQDAGHKVVLIIGDYTARVGDPSGRSSLRPMLSGEQIDANAKTFQEQALRILDGDAELLELRHNGEWLEMALTDLLSLVRTTTVAQLLERDDFAKRWVANESISLLELLYPPLQGYDSVAVDADVELGGTDQTFNLLLGRDIQRHYGQPEQGVLTMPLLLGLDGVEKMSKSLGNHIGVTDPPGEIYGRTMSIPDSSLEQWYRLLLGRELEPGSDPLAAKRALARELTARYHGADAAEHASSEWDTVVVGQGVPSEIEEATFSSNGGPIHLPALIAELFGMSRSEARRLISQGGVSVD
ncbi:MAG TPA: tyrosine--tRNA ligase, partial [Solirubrobacteraceae bacterium]